MKQLTKQNENDLNINNVTHQRGTRKLHTPVEFRVIANHKTAH